MEDVDGVDARVTGVQNLQNHHAEENLRGNV